MPAIEGELDGHQQRGLACPVQAPEEDDRALGTVAYPGSQFDLMDAAIGAEVSEGEPFENHVFGPSVSESSSA